MNPRPVLPMTETTQQDPVTGTAASRESHGGQPDVPPIPTGDDGHSVRSVHPLLDASAWAGVPRTSLRPTMRWPSLVLGMLLRDELRCLLTRALEGLVVSIRSHPCRCIFPNILLPQEALRPTLPKLLPTRTHTTINMVLQVLNKVNLIGRDLPKGFSRSMGDSCPREPSHPPTRITLVPPNLPSLRRLATLMTLMVIKLVVELLVFRTQIDSQSPL
jgi:hypothetical protein